jgi:lysophospholipase L1-like esterase
LRVEAFIGNLDPGWGVEFILKDKKTNGTRIGYDYVAPFEHNFTNLSKSDYQIEALIIDGGGTPITGEYMRDMKDPVGIGDYYVAFGDSITFGKGDDNSLDDVSLDGRNSGGGYEPILNDLLTSYKGYPHTVVNEGVSGEDSVDGFARIGSVLSAHPEANYILILFGTNDSGRSIKSGLGLNPGDDGYVGSYKDNMQRIIDIVLSAGKEPLLAKVPIALGECSFCAPYSDPDTAIRNTRYIQKYNQVVEELVSANAITAVSPDLYDYFMTHPEEMIDNLHPNGTGYISIGSLWFDALFGL